MCEREKREETVTSRLNFASLLFQNGNLVPCSTATMEGKEADQDLTKSTTKQTIRNEVSYITLSCLLVGGNDLEDKEDTARGE